MSVSLIILSAQLGFTNPPEYLTQEVKKSTQEVILDRHLLFSDAANLSQAKVQRALSLTSTPNANEFGVIRSRSTEINYDALTVGDQKISQSSVARKVLDLNLFEDTILRAVAKDIEYHHDGFDFKGSIQGDKLSSINLCARGSAIIADVLYQGRFFTIRSSANGMHTIAEVDRSLFPDEMPPINISSDASSDQNLDDYINSLEGTSHDDGSTIDIMVAYTTAVKNIYGQSGVEALIDLSIMDTNQAYSNSHINTQLRLVHTVEVLDYNEASNMFGDLENLTFKDDGKMDEIHVLRDQYAADFVALLVVNFDLCGIAYIMQDPVQTFEERAFNVTNHSCATSTNTFAHEIGHNMGMAHNVEDAQSLGTYNYSFGYWAPNEAFRTVMAYQCPGFCPRVLNYSNPNVLSSGLATGVADASDNARTANLNAIVLSNFRNSDNSGALLPDLTSPEDGSTIVESDVTFEWTMGSNQITEHWLEVGTEGAGSFNIDTGSTGLNTSKFVAGIPLTGDPIYARLWSSFSGIWLFEDFIFTTINVPVESARITEPVDGATLSSAAVTFQVDRGSGVVEIWMSVGTNATNSESSSYVGNILEDRVDFEEKFVEGLATDGQDIYIRLWSHISNVWHFRDTVYHTGSVTPNPDCGNGDLDDGEECDDANLDNGDGCSNICSTLSILYI